MEGLALIPTPPHQLRPWAVEFYINGTGGSMMSVGQGTGGVEPNFWFMVPWGRKINSSVRSEEGRQMRKKLSALELADQTSVAANQSGSG
jgi:hypothetical protein